MQKLINSYNITFIWTYCVFFSLRKANVLEFLMRNCFLKVEKLETFSKKKKELF